MNVEIPLVNIHSSCGRITRIEGGPGFKRHLACLGIRVNKKICMVTVQPFRGPMVVEVDGKQIAIGRGMCRRIFVEVER